MTPSSLVWNFKCRTLCFGSRLLRRLNALLITPNPNVVSDKTSAKSEFDYYKKKVDENAQLTQQIGAEFRIYRKDLGLLIRRFESFCVNDLSSKPGSGIDLTIYESFRTNSVCAKAAENLAPKDQVNARVEDKGKLRKSNRMCRRFVNGDCKFGKRCWFSHDRSQIETVQSGEKKGKTGRNESVEGREETNQKDKKGRVKAVENNSNFVRGKSKSSQKAPNSKITAFKSQDTGPSSRTGDARVTPKNFQEMMLDGFRDISRQINKVVSNRRVYERSVADHGYHCSEYRTPSYGDCFRSSRNNEHCRGHC